MNAQPAAATLICLVRFTHAGELTRQQLAVAAIRCVQAVQRRVRDDVQHHRLDVVEAAASAGLEFVGRGSRRPLATAAAPTAVSFLLV